MEIKIGDKIKLRGSSIVGDVTDIFSDYGTITNLKSKIIYVQVKIDGKELPMVYQMDELKKIEY